MLSSLSNVISKELTDAFRDQRSIIASLAVAVATPLLLYVMLTTIARTTSDDASLEVALVGGESAPNLIVWLSDRDVEFTDVADEDAAIEAIGDGPSLAMVISEDYVEDYERLRPAEIRLYADFKEQSAQSESNRLERLIRAYGGQVDAARSVARGVPPTQTRAIDVQTYDLSEAGGFSAYFAGLLPYMFLLAGFISGAFMAADAVAGERERHSLQPLLAQPVDALTIVIGKWAVAALIAVIVSTVTIGLGGYLLSIAPLEEIGLRFVTSPGAIALGALSAAPLAALAAALQIMLAAQAKTYREAATYAQYTMFLPILIVGAKQFANLEYPAIANYLPITGHDHALREIFLEGAAPLVPILATAVASFALIALFLLMTVRTLSSEKAVAA